MPFETLFLIAYCFGFVLNILITVGILGKPDVREIKLGHIVMYGCMVLLSWIGTFIVVLATILNNLEVVIYYKKDYSQQTRRPPSDE